MNLIERTVRSRCTTQWRFDIKEEKKRTLKKVKEKKRKTKSDGKPGTHMPPRPVHIFSADHRSCCHTHIIAARSLFPVRHITQTASSTVIPVTPPLKFGVHCTRRSQATKRWLGLCQSRAHCESANGLFLALLQCFLPRVRQRLGQPRHS